MFSDMADTRSNEQGTNVHGLFGAIIVEAAGSVWLDPTNGKPLDSGLFADIYNPAKPAFREYAVFFHDELEIKNKEGQQPVDPHTGLPNGTNAISYRSEPMRNRLPLDPHADHTDARRGYLNELLGLRRPRNAAAQFLCGREGENPPAYACG